MDFFNTMGGPRILSETLYRRGANTIEKARQFLDPSFYHPSPPSDLPDLEMAASRLDDAIQKNELIGVWGDFDVDGQTSTAVLVDTLRHLGARVCYYIPNRSSESHGINLLGLQSFLKQGVQVLLTCDTGVTDQDPIAYAQSEGVDVLVTDHHALPPKLPTAYAVINPLRLPATHPLAVLCGVGTAYKLSEELLTRRGDPLYSLSHTDLVALGSVADVASLTQDNRFLVQKGLHIFRENCRPGLKAILDQADVDISHLSE
jgi:single-stranded-DNA-specific exonuclease